MVSSLLNKTKGTAESQALGSPKVISSPFSFPASNSDDAMKVANLANRSLLVSESMSMPRNRALDQKYLVGKIQAKVRTCETIREFVESAKKTFFDWRHAYELYHYAKEELSETIENDKNCFKLVEERREIVDKLNHLINLHETIKAVKKRIKECKSKFVFEVMLNSSHETYKKDLEKLHDDKEYSKNREILKKLIKERAKAKIEAPALLSRKDELDELLNVYEGSFKKKRDEFNAIQKFMMLEMKGLLSLVVGEEDSHDFEVDYESLAYEIRHIDTVSPVIVRNTPSINETSALESSAVDMRTKMSENSSTDTNKNLMSKIISVFFKMISIFSKLWNYFTGSNLIV